MQPGYFKGEPCGAPTKEGTPCKRLRRRGFTTCRMHAEGEVYRESVIGIRADGTIGSDKRPAWNDGRRRASLPGRMRQDYERALNDPELLSQKTNIAMLDARIEDLLRMSETGESGAAWKEANKALRRYDEIIAGPGKPADKAAMGAIVLNDLRNILHGGLQGHMVWEEIRVTAVTQKALVADERKRMIEQNYVIGVEQAEALIGAMVSAVREAAGHDSELLERVSIAYIRLTGGPLDTKDVPEPGVLDAEFYAVPGT